MPEGDRGAIGCGSEALRMTEGDQLAVREAARVLARKAIAPTAAVRDRSAAWPASELETLGLQGYLGMLVPEKFGGSGLDFSSYCIAQEEISAADCGVGTICHVHNMCLHTLVQCGSQEQKTTWLPRAARGDLVGAWMLSEPHAGSDTAAFTTSARRDGDTFILRGTKQFVLNGSQAGIALVLAVTDAGAGKHGMSVFLVNPRTPGYVVTRVEEKLGQHTAHTAQVQFDDMRVPADAVVGAIGQGYRVALSGIANGRIAIAAQAVGVAQAALDSSVRYAMDALEVAFFANATQGHFDGQHMIRGEVALRALGVVYIPVFNIENACASGSSAFNLAFNYIRSGAAEVAVVIGAEKMFSADRGLMFSAFDSAWDVHMQEDIRARFAELGAGF